MPGNAADGDASTYWESTDNAFPQWLQVDLGASQELQQDRAGTCPRPPRGAPGPRRCPVQGSTGGSSFSTIVGSANYTFNPSTGNTVTITFPSASYRYVRLNVTANTGWPAGQVSEFQVWTS